MKQEKEESSKISAEDRKELDNRLEGYKNHPTDVLNWENVKSDY